MEATLCPHSRGYVMIFLSEKDQFWKKVRKPPRSEGPRKNQSFFHENNSQLFKVTKNVEFGFFQFWLFSSIFVLLKLTCLVTLFDLENTIESASQCLKITQNVAFWIFQFWHFSSILCLVTLFDHQNRRYLAFLMNFCPL